jgi:Carboxypeptidase regulatory-like domain
MKAARSSACAVLLCLLFPTIALAQVTSADIVGRVTDTSGAVLPGATVIVENLGTGETRAMPANEAGDFAFNLLPIGRYAVRIELQGFRGQTTNVTLATGDRIRVDGKLQIGTVQETIYGFEDSEGIQALVLELCEGARRRRPPA